MHANVYRIMENYTYQGIDFKQNVDI